MAQQLNTYAHLRKAVAAYMTRDEKAFERNGFDCLKQAINDAHQWAQRTHIFEQAAVFITVPSVSLTDGADLSTAVLRGTSTSVEIRTLKHAWLPTSDGGGELPLGIISRDAWVQRLRRRYGVITDNGVNQMAATTSGVLLPLEVVYAGSKIYLSNRNDEVLTGLSSTDIHFDAIRWLPDYNEQDDTDFFLLKCFDFMTFRAVYQLNAYLKEDMRVPISKDLLEDTWLSVIRMDTSLTFHSTEDTSLD